eukprot:148900_1
MSNLILQKQHELKINSNFQDKTEFVLLAANKALNHELTANTLYNTIKNGYYKDADDILDDLIDINDSHIVNTVLTQIQNDTPYQEAEHTKTAIHYVLTKIYEDNVTNIDAFEAYNPSVKMSEKSRKLIDVIMNIVNELNKNMKKQIPLNNVSKLFNQGLNEYTLSNMSTSDFCQRAKQFAIKAPKATKLFNKIQQYLDNQQNVSNERTDINVERKRWKRGSICEIYSNAFRNWYIGEIIDVSRKPKTEREWLKVEYLMHDRKRIKQIQRFSSHIRPTINSLYSEQKRSSVNNSAENELRVGSKCEIYFQMDEKWREGKIVTVFKDSEAKLEQKIDNNEEWFSVQCLDNSFHRIQKNSKFIRVVSQSSKESKPHFPLSFDIKTNQAFFSKLQDVIEHINYEIQISRDFLYQVYSISSNNVINKFLSYDSEKANNNYKRMTLSGNSTAMFCNGVLVKQYGQSKLFKCKQECHTDCLYISSSLDCELLNKNAIIRIWKNNQYNQRWLLSSQKEDVIAAFVNIFNVTNISTAIKLYKDLTEHKTLFGIVDDDSCDDQMDEIMFQWTHGVVDMNTLDQDHFLYIASVVLDNYKYHIDKTKVLSSLRKINLNGKLFSKIDTHAFVKTILCNSFPRDNISVAAVLKFKQYAERIYKEIYDIDVSRISTSIKNLCIVSLSSENEASNKYTAPTISLFQQWMIQFNSQYNRNISFGFDVFKPMVQAYQNDRSSIITLKYETYSIGLNKRSYVEVLKSFISWSVSLNCANWRCNGQLKLDCFCNIEEFQKFTYSIIMAIIKRKTNNDYNLLDTLKNRNNKESFIAVVFCDILPEAMKKAEYFATYISLIIEWISFEWFNFECDDCHYINKTIMIGRVYQYAKSLGACRLCNGNQRSRNTDNQYQFDINIAIQNNQNMVLSELPVAQKNILSGLTTYLLKNKYCKNYIKEIHELEHFLKIEVYDTDSILHDIDEAKQSNIYSHIQHPIVSQFVRRYLDQYVFSSYQPGQPKRYLVLQPKFFSLLKEICLNDIYRISVEDWKNLIVTAASH